LIVRKDTSSIRPDLHGRHRTELERSMTRKSQEILASIKAGERLVLTNRDGVEYGIPIGALYFSDEEKWVLVKDCLEPAGHLGLGTCSCGSFEPSQSQEISHAEALVEINALIERERQNDEPHQKEIAWA